MEEESKPYWKLWSRYNAEDKQYLIDFYVAIGIEEMAFALNRTKSSIAQKVYLLRKAGLMPKHKPGEYLVRKSLQRNW